MTDQKNKKRVGKIIGFFGLGLLALIILVLISLFFYSRHLASSGLSIYEGEIKIAGITEPVDVYRDAYGVPHILARNEADLYLATGYVMAQDRLWQMDLLRRVASGRLAEVFGSRFVDTDLLLRALRIPEKARRVLAATPLASRQAVEAFAAGVNAFIQEKEKQLPLEFRLLRYKPERWEPEHSAYLIGYMGWDLAFAWGIESLLWEVQEKLTGQEEKLAELLAEPNSPIFIYSNFSLPLWNNKKEKKSTQVLAEKKQEGNNNYHSPTMIFEPESNIPSKNSGQAFFDLNPYPAGWQSLPNLFPSLWPLVELGETQDFLADRGFLASSSQPAAPKKLIARDPETLVWNSSLLEAAQLLTATGLVVKMGSNNWAVNSNRSTTGQPILANDMHLSLSLPNIWYPLHQSVPGKLKVSGVALPGEPFIVAGHNEHIGWGMTNAMADDLDFYLEKISPDKPDQYLIEGEWRPMEVRKEIIRVKGGKEVSRELRFTHRGPVISEFKNIKDRVISMRWTGYEESNELLAVYLLNRARNWSEFREALRHFRSLSQNVIYADSEGNIGIQLAGGIPKRPGPGWNLRPGEFLSSDWSGLIPFEELPFIFNPPAGYVLSANNKSVDQSYPYSISYFFLSQDRAERIQEFLTSKDKLSPQDFATLQADFQSKLVTHLKPFIVDILMKTSEYSELEKQAWQRLKDWKGEMAASSPEATIFEILYFELSRELIEDELGPDLSRRFLGPASRIFLPYFLEQTLAKKDSFWADDITTPEVKETVEAIVLRSFRQTINFLQKNWGKDISRWQWGKGHQLTLTHPLGEVKLLNWLFKLNRGPYPVGGAAHTVCPFGYSLSSPFRVNHGASQRHVYTIGNWDDSLTIIPGGVSGAPASRHYADQAPLYLRHEYRSDFFEEEKIIRASKYHLTIAPDNGKN